MLILALSPYYDRTKIALYDNYDPLWNETQRYTSMELEIAPGMTAQAEFRTDRVKELLVSQNEILNNIGVFVSVGGMLHPLERGVYQIGMEMIDDLLSCKYGDSPMNLGAPIALALANAAGTRFAFVVDPPVVDEMPAVSHMTGLPEISRKSVFHVHNQRAAAASEAEKLGKAQEECNFIVCNFDTTISVAAHSGGRVIDVNDIQSGSGPMSPRQTGDLPPLQLVELCFSGKYSLEELRIRITGAGGFVGHLGTDDFDEITRRVRAGDRKFKTVFNAFIYQLAKYIGAAAGALAGRVDSIILTGTMASNELFLKSLTGMVQWIAPISNYSGNDDMSVLINTVMRVMTGAEEIKTYV